MSEVFLSNGGKDFPKRDCYFYNWGGDCSKGRPSYPREYGARCEFNNVFFERHYLTGDLIPDCSTCPWYELDQKDVR